MRTLEFSAIFGVVPGFAHDNEVRVDPVERVAREWHAAAEDARAHGHPYVTAALAERRVLYPREKGSPMGGEVSVEAMGACNPRCENLDSWQAGVRRVAEATRRALGQETVRLVFRTVEDELLQDSQSGQP